MIGWQVEISDRRRGTVVSEPVRVENHEYWVCVLIGDRLVLESIPSLRVINAGRIADFVATPRTAEWRPISEAPKDGTAIAGRHNDKPWFKCSWHANANMWAGDDGLFRDPTHFFAVPEWSQRIEAGREAPCP